MHRFQPQEVNDCWNIFLNNQKVTHNWQTCDWRNWNRWHCNSNLDSYDLSFRSI